MADSVTLTIKSMHDSPHVLTDTVAGSVRFDAGEVKTLEVSQGIADAIKNGTEPGWEVASKAEAKASAAEAERKTVPAPAQDKKLTRADLDAMTKDQLVEHAEALGIEVSHGWLKEEIVDAIVKGQRKA